jgi:hypothetical protein
VAQLGGERRQRRQPSFGSSRSRGRMKLSGMGKREKEKLSIQIPPIFIG